HSSAMIVHVLASDYDNTLAEHGRISETTARALARVRESGRKVMLVTGRMLPELKSVCPDADRMFDAIVAENGAVVYFPERREVEVIGSAPEPALVEALRRRGVPIDLGSSIIATVEPHSTAALAAIRDAGVERSLIFNKGAVMLLPGGVTKGTGLEVALAAMDLSAHNMVGIGDGENDHAFLSLSECAVAVADAVPALRERADYVTRAPHGLGVTEFIEEHVLNDLADLLPRLARHRIALGQDAEGQPVSLAAHGTGLLVVGPSATGKSTLTGALVERLVQARRTVLLLDPEGDYQTLSEVEGVVVLGGKAEQTLPTPDEVSQLLRHPHTSLVLNLSAMTQPEKVDYATTILAAMTAVRSSTGLPHWLIIDEAHHVMPADGSPAAELLRAGPESFCLITLSADKLASPTLPHVNAVASTELEALHAGIHAVLRTRPQPAPNPPSVDGGPLERGDAALAWLASPPRAVRFHVARTRVQHRRHIRKYTEGELPPDRSFFFRGPQQTLNLRAANLARFVELADGVDEGTWAHHLRQRHYSAWVRDMIKDPELAAEIEGVESSGLSAAQSRRGVLDAIRARYAV
ncbi:MAG TPA: HAD hydrolase family protein, partial [Candidatus Limnocylindria bacterium]|nr:HAD hydrolase family protein [Candidatus Limnocylindria bacterium]